MQFEAMKTQQQQHIAVFLLAIQSITVCASACSSSHHGNNDHHPNGTTSGRHTRGGYANEERRELFDPFGNAVDLQQFHDGAGAWCGTQSLPLYVQIQVMASVRAWGDRKQRRRLTGGPYTIDVRFVDIKASDADADVPQANIDASMAILNDHFATTDFNFRWIETVRAVNSDFATCEFTNVDKHASIGQAYRDGDETTLNVYLCDFPEENRAGVAYYPYDVPLSLNTDGVYLDPRYLGENQITLSHEAGHWFGLLHPFENGCEFPGDGINDTPYQTILGDSDVSECLDNLPDTCPEQPGNDPIDNIMGYVNKCIVGFTPDQSEFMCNVYEKYRLYASQTEYCFIDMIVEFNNNPGDITIFVENNGIYYTYLEKDGADYAANERVVFEESLYDGPGSVTIEDSSGNGFAGGRVIIEVLEGSSSNSARTTILDFEGGSFTDIGTEEFVVPDNCVAVQQQPADAPTQPPIGATPSPSARATDQSTSFPTLPDTFPPTTQAPVEQPTTIAPSAQDPIDSNQPPPVETVAPSSRQTTVEITEPPTASTPSPSLRATNQSTPFPTLPASFPPTTQAPVEQPTTIAPTALGPTGSNQPSPLETVEPSGKTPAEITEPPSTSPPVSSITDPPTTLATVNNTESPTTSATVPKAQAPATMTQVPDTPSATIVPTLMHPQQPSTQLRNTVTPVIWPWPDWPWPIQPTNSPISTTGTPSSSLPTKHHNVFSRSKGKGTNYYDVYSRKSKGKGKQSYKRHSKKSKMKKSSKKHGSQYSSTYHGTRPYYQPPSQYTIIQWKYPASSSKKQAKQAPSYWHPHRRDNELP